jgi:hypothetical protein
MHTITQQLKNAAVNGCIPLEKAIAIAGHFDTQRDDTRTILKECEKNVGMYLGEKINAHIADLDGSFFNERDYNYERLPGEQ